MSDRAAEARAEAERRNPLPECCDGVETHCRWHRQVERLREEFEEGRRWADANPKPHTVTTSEAALTDDEWRRYQDFPEQGYSHRHYVDTMIRHRLEALGIEVEDDRA